MSVGAGKVVIMTDFVLIPGAWLGAWAWQPVVDALTAQGHRAFPVTLPGLAERSGTQASEIGFEDHVADVVALMERHDLRDAVVAGHSYAGTVAGTVTDRVPDRIRHTVYVDAGLPIDGKSLIDVWSEAGRQWMADTLAANDGLWPPPEAEEFYEHGFTPEQAQWMVAHTTPVPGRCATEPAHLTRSARDYPSTYIACTQGGDGMLGFVKELAELPGWRVVTLETGHWPMVTTPDALAEVLIEAAG
jgi:pimeloyl-ACP methyl ester carboxylesterase